MAGRLPTSIRSEIENAIESAKLERASLTMQRKDEECSVTVKTGDHAEVFNGNVTEFVREKVSLHHGSWIIAPLERVLEWDQSKDDGTQDEYDIVNRLQRPLAHPDTMSDAAQVIKDQRELISELISTINRIRAAVDQETMERIMLLELAIEKSQNHQ